MKIPLVGIPEAPGPQRSFAPLSITTYDQVGQAGARLGNAIEGVATDLPVRIKTAIDAGNLAKLETNQEAYFQDTVDKIRTGPDANNPEKWLEHWKDAQTNFTDKATEDDGIKSLSFAARREYHVSMAKWSAMTTQQVGHMATNKAIENAGANLINDYHAKLLMGDEAGAVTQIKKGITNGSIKPEMGFPLIREAPAENEFNQAVKMMSLDYKTGGGPIVLEDKLKEMNEDGSFKYYPHLQGQRRESITFDAFRNARQLQGQVAQKYAVLSASGQQADPNEVQQDLQAGAISPAVAKSLLKPQRVFRPEDYASAVNVISKYDPKDDPSHENEAKIWSSLNEIQPYLSPQSSARLNELFKEKLKDKSPLNSPVGKDGNAIIAENFRLGVFGKFETKVEQKDGSFATVVNPKVLDTAQQNRAKAQTALNEWLSKPANENATPAEVQKFLSDTVRTQRLGALWAPIINPATGKKVP